MNLAMNEICDTKGRSYLFASQNHFLADICLLEVDGWPALERFCWKEVKLMLESKDRILGA